MPINYGCSTFATRCKVLGRIWWRRPGMTDTRLAFLEAATEKSVSDPNFLAEGDKRHLYTDYVIQPARARTP